MPIRDITKQLKYFNESASANDKYLCDYLKKGIGSATDYGLNSQQYVGMALWLVLTHAFDYQNCKADPYFAEISDIQIESASNTTKSVPKLTTVDNYVRTLCNYLPKVVQFCNKVERIKVYEFLGILAVDEGSNLPKASYALNFCKEFLNSISFVTEDIEKINWAKCENKLSRPSPLRLEVQAEKSPIPFPNPQTPSPDDSGSRALMSPTKFLPLTMIFNQKQRASKEVQDEHRQQPTVSVKIGFHPT